ncbi:Fms-interacting protein-domain-containing protein [Irpex rosettiformis]|uniref:Fms-interacting protein-domain-containing protein n=1 Tax=Irpex rosettiformis TaxID=378272 RepID=A0ACB8UEF8_9APHY|nr:Fms-interacting protein-domain-containing protein [Irpex rosettiformis]
MALVDTTNNTVEGDIGRTLPPSPDAVVESLRDLASSTYLNHDGSLIHIRAGALFARLKALNRAANVATREHKQATSDMRHDMDQTHLSLQNLLYEKRHLEREIEKCRQFASIYQDIPLYSEEEFMEKAPEALRSEEVLSNEHALMLNRLNFELAERQRLDQAYKELVRQKEELLKESKVKQTTMEGVKTQIDGLMKVPFARIRIMLRCMAHVILFFLYLECVGGPETGCRPRSAQDPRSYHSLSRNVST